MFSWFGSDVIENFKFGSYTRGTILPRKVDSESDIDYMVVFNNYDGCKPQAYLNRLNRFVKYYIKIDIEGSEASLLKGATNIIKRDRPILLLAIYHKWDDIFKLQNYLINLNLEYKFYIRHYSLSVAKTILYCIPN